MSVKRLICRVTSEIHRTVLETMGVEEIVHPERETAERLVTWLEFDKVLDAYALTDGYKIAEIEIPDYGVGQTIGKLALPMISNVLWRVDNGGLVAQDISD